MYQSLHLLKEHWNQSLPPMCCPFPGIEIKDPADPLMETQVNHPRRTLISLLQSYTLISPQSIHKTTSYPTTPTIQIKERYNFTKKKPKKTKNHLPHIPAWPDPKLSYPFWPSHAATLRLKNSPQEKLSPTGTNNTT